MMVILKRTITKARKQAIKATTIPVISFLLMPLFGYLSSLNIDDDGYMFLVSMPSELLSLQGPMMLVRFLATDIIPSFSLPVFIKIVIQSIAFILPLLPLVGTVFVYQNQKLYRQLAKWPIVVSCFLDIYPWIFNIIFDLIILHFVNKLDREMLVSE